ncbi:ABC transporter ATP-binding protein [Paenibacillus silvae]|uniref:ABC transporter ATP-binding protein n=1 Tax=Paenibacillus silvae TaxID=1325358 RepID=A0ABQ1ZF83_9BACL|nr:ABC transporter ATP-binding protein [Paenibacillus silvae]GGH58065.1 ABC transporter ATP-binding protein [Paenibacillus silvae]
MHKLLGGEKFNNLKNLLFVIALVYRASPPRIIISITKSVIERVFNVFFFIYLLQYIFECIENGTTFYHLFWILSMIIVVRALIGLMNIGYNYYISRNNPIVFRYIFGRIMNKSTEIELYKFEQPDFYNDYTLALDQSSWRAEEVTESMSYIISQFIGIAATVILIVSWDPTLIFFTIVPIINSYLVGLMRNKVQYEKDMSLLKDERIAAYSKRIFYEKKYAQEVRLFGIKDIFLKKQLDSYRAMRQNLKKHGIKLTILDIWNVLVMDTLLFLAVALYSTYQIVVNHNLSIAVYVSIMTAVNSVSWSFNGLIYEIAYFAQHGRYIENIKKFINYEMPVTTTVNSGLTPPFESLEMINVSFQYEGSNKAVLKNIDLKISKGEKIALVGYNGAGKTTLIKLLMQLYDAQQGSIFYNGVDIRQFDKDDYYSRFSAVFQDFQLYALSLQENILMDEAKLDKDRIKVLEALEKAGFEERLSKLDKGIDSVLTKEFDNDGVVLSGGEGQKIAVARAFAKSSEIIVMDEPSSALDPIAEYQLFQKLMEIANNKTVIFISHRLSTAKLADRIYMLEDGEIIEEGTHEELMGNHYKYSEMFTKQAEKYINYESAKDVI